MLIHYSIICFSIKRIIMKTTLLFLCLIILNANCLNAQDVKIGKQVWMSKNLDVSTFRNGDTIFHAKNSVEWEKAAENKLPAWRYAYDNDPNKEVYGRLYNWYAFNDPRGLAPRGYHLPSNEEWAKLIKFLRKGGKIGLKLKSKNGYKCRQTSPNGDRSYYGNGSNSSGFDGLPGGMLDCNGRLNEYGNTGYWWHSEKDSLFSWSVRLTCNNNNQDLMFQDVWKCYGASVRCIKD